MEFALVGPIFVALLLVMIQSGVVFFIQQVLQTATTEAARLIMTGQAQAEALTSSQFQKRVCDAAGALVDCSRLSANVQTFSSFSSMSQPNPIQNGSFTGNGLNFDIGGSGDIVLVQVFYQLPVIAAPFGLSLANISGNTRVLMATSVFRNEPFPVP